MLVFRLIGRVSEAEPGRRFLRLVEAPTVKVGPFDDGLPFCARAWKEMEKTYLADPEGFKQLALELTDLRKNGATNATQAVSLFRSHPWPRDAYMVTRAGFDVFFIVRTETSGVIIMIVPEAKRGVN